MTARRNAVGNYRRRGTFRAQHAEKSGRAAQDTSLPPRCEHCRLPGTIPIRDGDVTFFYCDNHVTWHKENEND